MKLALSMLCENPDRRTGLSTLFHEFVAHALVLRPDVSWVLFAGPNQPWTIDDPRVEVVRRFPANDRPYARLVADHLRVAPEARCRGADALLTVGFVPLRDAGLPVVMHVFSVHHLRAGGGLRAAYRRWAMRRGMRRARLVIANSQWTWGQVGAAYGALLRRVAPEEAQRTGARGQRAEDAGHRPEVVFGCRAGSPDPAGSSVAAGSGDPALHQTGGGGPEVVVSYEGVQHERFRPEGPRGREDLPREYLLWSSNFYRYKRAELALAAYAALPRATRTRFPLVLAGGDWHGGRGRAEAAARRLGIAEQVRFVGWVSDADLPALYRGARAHVLSTEEETFGRSVVEAMACGCPCVLQDLPVLREVAGGAAVFTDFAPPQDAAAVLERVCTDDELAAQLREAGLRRAAAFSFEQLARERLEAVQRALEAPACSRFAVDGSRLEEGIGQTDANRVEPSRTETSRAKPSPLTGLTARASRLWPVAAAAACAVAGGVVFQFFGNANHGYIDTNSLFWWWGYQWWNPDSQTQHGWLVLAISAWLLARNARNADCGLRSAECDEPNKRALGGSAGLDQSAIRTPQSAITAPAAALLAGLALHAVGFAAQQARLSILALLLFTWGVLRLGGGRRWGRAAVFPLGFMVFAIPVNVLDSVGFWLRLWVIHASTAIAHAAGIGVIENGTQLIAPDGRYQYDVAAACSGVRSLMALAALSLLIGYLNFRSWWRRGLLLLLCFPLVYVGNLARITAIVFAAQAGGPRWGNVAHAVMGWAIFAIVLGGVMGAAQLLRRFAPEQPGSGFTVHGLRLAGGRRQTEPSRDEPSRTAATRGAGARRGDIAECGVRSAERAGPHELDGLGGADESAIRSPQSAMAGPQSAMALAAIVVVLAVAEMLFLHRVATRPERGEAGVALAADGRDPVELPAILGGDWVGLPAAVTPVEREILPPDTGYSRIQYVSSRQPRRVFLSIVLSGRDRTSIHRPELCLVGQGWTITGRERHRFANPAGAAIPATVLRVVHRDPARAGGSAAPQLVAYWFVGDDRVVAGYWQRLAWDAWYRVVHGRADRWAYVLVQTDAADGEAAALARMQQVLDRTLPGFEKPHGKAGFTTTEREARRWPAPQVLARSEAEGG